MVRYGAVEQEMRPMKADDLLITRLQLLIIMAKAYLKGYPLGKYRKKAISRNARFVFYEAIIRTGGRNSESSSENRLVRRLGRRNNWIISFSSVPSCWRLCSTRLLKANPRGVSVIGPWPKMSIIFASIFPTAFN